MPIGNLFNHATPPSSGEAMEVLLSHRNLVVERVVSSDEVTPTTYCQSEDEWVVLLRGQACLRVEGRMVELGEGDYLFLPAGMEHTVDRVSSGAIWLAVHLHPDPPPTPARGDC